MSLQFRFDQVVLRFSLSLLALAAMCFHLPVVAQGLSGPPARLEETLGDDGGAAAAAAAEEEAAMEEEYGYEEEYYDPSYDGGGSSSRSRAPQSDAVQTYLGNLTNLTSGFKLASLLSPNNEVAVDGGPVLGREAEQVFSGGDHSLALSLLFGHMVTEYEDAIVGVRTVKYSSTLKRPIWSIRFGVSMAVRGDEFSDAKPIREGANSRRSSSSSSSGFEESYEEESYQEESYDNSGEPGMEGEEEMDSSGFSSGSSRFGSSRSSHRTIRSMLSETAEEELDKSLGLVAEVLAKGFNERFQRGDFGPALIAVTAPAPADSVSGGSGRTGPPPGAPMSEGLMDAMAEAAEPLPMWQPGIVYLGSAPWQELVPLARQKKIDVLLHFDVVLKPDRNGEVQNISRCRMINVHDGSGGKSMGVSKGMDNWEAAQLAAAGRMGERAYVEEQMSYLFTIIDNKLKVVDMPKVSQDVARRRIASLIASSQDQKLRSLAEVRYYQSQGLINEAEVETAFDIIGGIDALTLLHGPLNERLRLVRKLAVEEQGRVESDSSF